MVFDCIQEEQHGNHRGWTSYGYPKYRESGCSASCYQQHSDRIHGRLRPVEQGFVPNLTHPGGNITGFANPEFSIAGKWADLLKQSRA